MPNYTVIDVYVNVLPGAGVTKKQIAEAIKSANGTLKKAGAKIRLKLDAKRHIRSPARVGGTNDDADAGPNERTRYRRRGKKELQKRFKGRGVKLWFCDNILVRKGGQLVPKGCGLSFHKNPNAFISIKSHVTGDPPNQTLDTGEMGRTVAHELCHILTIKGHSTEDDNLMNESGSGSKLDDAQRAEIHKGALLRGRKTKSKQAPNQAPTKQTKKFGCWVDENEPPSQNFLAAAYLEQSAADLPWNGTIQLVGLIDHAKPVDLTFDMSIMTPGKGDAAAKPRWGICIAVRGDGGGVPLPAGTLTDLATGETTALDEVGLYRQDSILDDFEGSEPDILPAFDEIAFTVGPEAFGELPEGSAAELVAAQAIPGSRVKAHLPIDGAELDEDADTSVALDHYLVDAGQTVVFHGRGFSSACPVYVYVEDEVVGSAQVAEDGSCEVEFAAPAEPGFYWVLAIDATGLSDFTILDVSG